MTLNVIKLDKTNVNMFAKNMHTNGKQFIVFLADWCGYCNILKPEWEKVIKYLQNNNNIATGYVVTASDKIMHHLPIETPSGFPTLRLYNNTTLLKDYNGPRNMSSFIKFIKDNMNNETPIKKSFQMVKKDKRVRKSNKGKKSKKNKRYNKSRKSKKNKRYAKLTNSVRNKRKKIKKRNDKSRRKNTK